MAPVRLELTWRLIRDLGLVDHVDVQVAGAEVADDAVLERIHTRDYIAAVKAASAVPPRVDVASGLGTMDVPVFPGMHAVSARIAQASRDAALAMWTGEVLHSVNFAGGLHHAMPSLASGFCVYNDAAIAIAALLDAGAERVAYVDVDVHHGDGVERIFWDDPRVLTVSLHETGQVLFPGTGFPQDTGGAKADGCAVNLAYPPGTGDAAWLRGFDAVVPPLLRAFRPQALVTQHGADSHVLDPLAHMALSLDAQRAAQVALHDLAHSLCDGRWLALGGGGYEVVDVVPRAWAHLVGIAGHHPVDPDTAVPETWRVYVAETLGRVAPQRMTDGADVRLRPFSSGHDTGDPADRAIMATRRSVFPLFGLDPWYD
jgi:acetoin utilization protein AcuC